MRFESDISDIYKKDLSKYLADKLEDIKARGTNDWWFKDVERLVDKAKQLRYK